MHAFATKMNLPQYITKHDIIFGRLTRPLSTAVSFSEVVWYYGTKIWILLQEFT